MTEAEFIAWQARIEKQLASFRQQLDALGKRVDSIGDYAGATHYLATQTKLSTDRRLNHLENNEAETK